MKREALVVSDHGVRDVALESFEDQVKHSVRVKVEVAYELLNIVSLDFKVLRRFVYQIWLVQLDHQFRISLIFFPLEIELLLLVKVLGLVSLRVNFRVPLECRHLHEQRLWHCCRNFHTVRVQDLFNLRVFKLASEKLKLRKIRLIKVVQKSPISEEIVVM